MIPGLPPLVHLETVTLGSDTSAVTLPASGTIAGHANFPAGSKHVVCIWQTRSTTSTTGDQGTNVTVNGDTGAKYDLQRLDGAGSSAAGSPNLEPLHGLTWLLTPGTVRRRFLLAHVTTHPSCLWDGQFHWCD